MVTPPAAQETAVETAPRWRLPLGSPSGSPEQLVLPKSQFETNAVIMSFPQAVID